MDYPFGESTSGGSSNDAGYLPLNANVSKKGEGSATVNTWVGQANVFSPVFVTIRIEKWAMVGIKSIKIVPVNVNLFWRFSGSFVISKLWFGIYDGSLELTLARLRSSLAEQKLTMISVYFYNHWNKTFE